MIVIRWLGAFGKGESLHLALAWELSQAEREVAGEPIRRGQRSKISRPRVGLLIKSAAVRRVFHCDTWSKPGQNGRLVKGRTMAEWKGHSEAFCLPHYAAIVVRNFAGLPTGLRRTINHFSSMYGLPVIEEGEVYKRMS